ncbi:hypothetical protein VN0244_01220 [Helicobacter pylori]|nr:hypothetical protein VN0244_01220 [Helicobacter pylori]
MGKFTKNNFLNTFNKIKEFFRHDECEVKDKIKILGNIQKYQMGMLKFYP